MTIIFHIFAVLLIYFSFRSFSGGVRYLRFFKSELSLPPGSFAPFATIFAPCRGLDEGLRENLGALFDQNYPGYEIVFVVDDPSDGAVPVINGLIAARGGRNRLVIAPRSTDSGQKVENLREAVLHADPRSEAFVFVDSDARPAADWLRHLVAPLSDEAVGVSTGYRWFIPGSRGFASELLSAWNASIASALGPGRNEFCWAGSMAMRRSVFERLNVRGRWEGTLSDDFVVARVVREAGMAIRFVPRALTASIENCSFRRMLEFTTRQMKLTRVYATPLWLVSFLGSGLFTFVMAAAILAVIFAPAVTLLFLSALVTVILVTAFSVGKAWLRLKAVRLVIPEAASRTFPQLTLWPLTQPLFLYNCACALFSRDLTWRGIRYRLVSENETRRIG